MRRTLGTTGLLRDLTHSAFLHVAEKLPTA